jgi:hypothetical protein
MRPHILFTAMVLSCFAAAVAQSPAPAPIGTEVAPGVALPDSGIGIVYGLDQLPSGPVLQHIMPNEVVTISHAGSNFLRGLVYSGPHQGVVLDGAHSQTVFTSPKAVFYVRLVGEDAEIMRKRVHLVWLQSNKKNRQLTDYSQNIFGGSRERNVDDVPCAMEMVDDTAWLKITPLAPLVPGEFAIAFLPQDVNEYPTVVYDFSLPGGKTGETDPYAPPPLPSTKAKQ